MIRILGGMPAGVLGLEAIDDVEEEAVWEELKLAAPAKRWALGEPDRREIGVTTHEPPYLGKASGSRCAPARASRSSPGPT